MKLVEKQKNFFVLTDETGKEKTCPFQNSIPVPKQGINGMQLDIISIPCSSNCVFFNIHDLDSEYILKTVRLSCKGFDLIAEYKKQI